MTAHSRTMHCLLWLLLVVPSAFGTTVGGGAEIPMMLAIQEFCNAKHPEYRQANDAAFEKWKQRNRKAVEEARADPEYASSMDAARKLVAAMTADQNSQQICSELAAKLSDPTFGGLYQPEYSAKAIEARVVDSETNQPLEGVTVLASWDVEAGGSKVFRMKLLEALTDKSGRFHLQAWGPETNPSSFGTIRFGDPTLILFKPGYRWESRSNIVVSEPRTDAVRYSDWNGKTIKMRKAISSIEYLGSMSTLRDELDRILTSGEEPCNWKRAPSTVKAVMLEEQRLIEQGLTRFRSLTSRLRTSEDDFARRGCGSVNAFLDGLRK